MKKIKIYIYFVLLTTVSIGLYSCSTDDNAIEWGNTKVYMPQAAILNGGLTNNYPVPLNNNASTSNYQIDTTTNKLRIFLGVYRSGLQPMKAFTVKVASDTTATTTALNSVSKGVKLPSDVYSLHSEVSVIDGQRESIFYLDVDLNKLITEYPGYANKKMVLVVGISDPTKYTLNENLSKTTVVIDGSSFMPVQKIVKGGDFENGSEQYWTILDTYTSVLPASYAAIANGALKFDYGTTPVVGEKCCYTKIELVDGVKYKFSCDFNSTGGSAAASCRFYLALSTVIPVAGISYKYDTGSTFYSMLDSWNGLKNPVIGTLPQKGGWQAGIDKTTGVFTSNFTGTGYIVIGTSAWTSSIGSIVIDNVKIEEQ